MSAAIHGEHVDPVGVKLAWRTTHDNLPDLPSHMSLFVKLEHVAASRFIAPPSLLAVTVLATNGSGVDMVNGCALSYALRDDRRLEFEPHPVFLEVSSA